MDRVCIVCSKTAYTYIEVEGIGAAFCRQHCEDVIKNVNELEDTISKNAPEKKRVMHECSEWLKSLPEKPFW